MECKLEQSIELVGTDAPSCDLVIGKIVQFHIQDDLNNKGKRILYKIIHLFILLLTFLNFPNWH